MKFTSMLKVNRVSPERHKILIAAEIIRKGGLVAFPTETVYGLGADALNASAVTQIYNAKKRPLDNPIIVHVSNTQSVHKLTRNIPADAKKLMDIFWPGPLTLILPASSIVPKNTTGGLETVAVRMPNSEVALSLIKESKVPIAAPSANLSGRPSPTTAGHVKHDLNGRIDMILDAGPVEIGLESTVVDMTKRPYQISRPGGLVYECLKSVLNNIQVHPSAIAERDIIVNKVISPGLKHKHYAPSATVIVVEGQIPKIFHKVQEIVEKNLIKGKKVGIIASDEGRNYYNANIVKTWGKRNNLTALAKNLFAFLREFDEEQVEIIVAEGVSEKNIGLAVMNRLRRASNFNIIKVK